VTRLRLCMLGVIGVGVVFAIVAFFVSGVRAAASVMVAVALAAANLSLLSRFIGGAWSGSDKTKSATQKWGLVAGLSMIGQLIVAGLALKLGLADPLPFVVGCAALPAGMVLGSVLADRLKGPEE